MKSIKLSARPMYHVSTAPPAAWSTPICNSSCFVSYKAALCASEASYMSCPGEFESRHARLESTRIVGKCECGPTDDWFILLMFSMPDIESFVSVVWQLGRYIASSSRPSSHVPADCVSSVREEASVPVASRAARCSLRQQMYGC